jgi:hypothetical protein
MVREALTHAMPVAVDGDRVSLAVAESDVHSEGLDRSRALVEDALSHVLGRSIAVEYRAGGMDARASTDDAAAPQRLDRAGDRSERLKAYRARDPALDKAVDALGLELLD